MTILILILFSGSPAAPARLAWLASSPGGERWRAAAGCTRAADRRAPPPSAPVPPPGRATRRSRARLAAGFEGAEAAAVYRAIGDFDLYWSGAEASSLAMDEQLQKNDPTPGPPPT
jgi:hypothetical protein